MAGPAVPFGTGRIAQFPFHPPAASIGASGHPSETARGWEDRSNLIRGCAGRLGLGEPRVRTGRYSWGAVNLTLRLAGRRSLERRGHGEFFILHALFARSFEAELPSPAG